MLKIGIDTRDMNIAKTGTRTYLEEMLNALKKFDSRCEVIEMSPLFTKKKLLRQESSLSKIWSHISYHWWKQIVLPIRCYRKNCDVIFCTDYAVPIFSPIIKIPVFHDVNFWANPVHYNRLWRFLLDVLVVPAARSADVVVTVSEFSKSEIIKYLGFESEKISVIPNAPKPFNKKGNKSHPEDISFDNKILSTKLTAPFILHVGVMEKRKNLVRLVDAFDNLKSSLSYPLQLILVGQKGPKKDLDDSKAIMERINRSKYKDDIILPGYVSDADLEKIYGEALLFAFPSLREGFGIPVLESFQHGVPVVASNACAIPEVGQDAVEYFDPNDIDQMSNAILKIIEGESLRKKMSTQGFEIVEEYSWEKSAEKFLDLLEKIIAEPC